MNVVELRSALDDMTSATRNMAEAQEQTQRERAWQHEVTTLGHAVSERDSQIVFLAHQLKTVTGSFQDKAREAARGRNEAEHLQSLRAQATLRESELQEALQRSGEAAAVK